MTEVVRIKFGVVVTLILQTAALVAMFTATKVSLEEEIEHVKENVRENTLEHKNREHVMYEFRQLQRIVHEMRKEQERRREAVYKINNVRERVIELERRINGR